MRTRLDYYRILQVHSLAEPEVIESAYKRLAKKYHPDVNGAKDADFRMKQLNEAYEILKDPEKRKRYDQQLAGRRENEGDSGSKYKNETENNAGPGGTVLNAYFSHLKDRNFPEAYALLSHTDRNRIPEEDFIRWQSAVSKIYRLDEYALGRTDGRGKARGVPYPQTTEFEVVTAEYNTVMNRLEKDIVHKRVVLDQDGWHVFLGYEDVGPFIKKFEALQELLTAREVVHEMVAFYSNMDHVSGLLNKKGFLEAAEKEIWRCGRYGNCFSLMLLEIHAGKNKGQEFQDHIAAWTGEILKNRFRRLDITARWEETSFMILMPETDLSGCVRAADKIRKALKAEKPLYGGKAYPITVRIGADVFGGSLEQTIAKLHQLVSEAKRHRGDRIAYPQDEWEGR